VSVILVEDEPLIQVALVEFIEDAGYPAEAAHNAEEAIELIERKKADLRLLITDIRIHSAGNKTGWDVAQYARQAVPGLPIIYISGDSAFHRQANAVPSSFFLSKPFRMTELLDCVRQALGEPEGR
jgi:DNA-binding NtrC family response regulator